MLTPKLTCQSYADWEGKRDIIDFLEDEVVRYWERLKNYITNEIMSYYNTYITIFTHCTPKNYETSLPC